MEDICDGYSAGLITWWPYYLSVIDFTDLTNLPSSSTVVSLYCPGNDNGHNVVGNTLNVLYISSTSLMLSQSPYYVINDVVISDGVTITIENGVEIIFMADYTIYVRGTFNFCHNIDTSSDKTRGLSDLTTYGYIHGDSSLIRKGSIAFDSDTNGEGLFCNILFENLNIAINTNRNGLTSPYIATVDNCEFNNIYRVFDGNSFVGDTSLFTDSYFHNIDEVAYGSAAIFDNCLFDNFGAIISAYGYYFTFTNNTINGDGTQNCFVISRSIIEYNVIDNCNIAITTNMYYNTIQYNTISNHNTAIIMGQKSNDDKDLIIYNNFISNVITLNNNGDTDETNCNYNYFGSSTSDQSVIASSMRDICDSSSLGLITFWPWFISEFIENAPLPIAYTFNFAGCSSIDSVTSYQITNNPTTNNPTTNNPNFKS
eukprot:44915_1